LLVTPRIHCEVLEASAGDDWLPRRGGTRELLPWADPYIARLIRQLESRYNLDDEVDELDNPFAADDAVWLPDACDEWEEADAWDDAFLPPPVERPRYRDQLPVYGGFPLLDDISKDDDADSI
jgi:hypothetical protein